MSDDTDLGTGGRSVMQKTIVRADPFPFRVGAVRLAYPGWLNGQHTVHDPRAKYEVAIWSEENGDPR